MKKSRRTWLRRPLQNAPVQAEALGVSPAVVRVLPYADGSVLRGEIRLLGPALCKSGEYECFAKVLAISKTL